MSAAGCGVRLGASGEGDPTPDGDPATPDAPETDPGPDGPAPLGRWGMAVPVPGASTAAAEDDASLSSTALEMVFAVVDATLNTKDLWYMRRMSPTALWGQAEKLGFNSDQSDETPRFSDDDLTLYFASSRTGGLGNLDIYKVTRPSVGAAWVLPPVPVNGVSTAGVDKWFMPCARNNTYLTILGNDIGEGTMGNAPVVNTDLSSDTGVETGTFLSKDCLTVYFSSTPNATTRALYVSTRTSLTAKWSTPARVDDFAGTGGAQEDPWISPDQKTFVFVSDTGMNKNVYISTR